MNEVTKTRANIGARVDLLLKNNYGDPRYARLHALRDAQASDTQAGDKELNDEVSVIVAGVMREAVAKAMRFDVSALDGGHTLQSHHDHPWNILADVATRGVDVVDPVTLEQHGEQLLVALNDERDELSQMPEDEADQEIAGIVSNFIPDDPQELARLYVQEKDIRDELAGADVWGPIKEAVRDSLFAVAYDGFSLDHGDQDEADPSP